MRSQRLVWGVAGCITLVVLAVVVALTSRGSSTASAATSSPPGLVSATILANNYNQGERSTVQYTFSQPVTLTGQPSAYLADFTLGSRAHPVAAAVETNGFVIEADFSPNVNVAQFQSATISSGAVAATSGSAPNPAASTPLTITTDGATAGPDFRGATVQEFPIMNQIVYFFDKPVYQVVPSDFGYYTSGSPTPTMGASIAQPGGFTPGSTSVTILFPAVNTSSSGAVSEFVLRGGATGEHGLANPAGLIGGNTSGVPGLLAASGENIASIARVTGTTYAFTFTDAPTNANPADFSLYTSSDRQLVGSSASVQGNTADVSFPALPSHEQVVKGSVGPGAIIGQNDGVGNILGSEPIGISSGSRWSIWDRGVAYIPTGPSIQNSPTSLSDASCASGDTPETGLQGQVPPAVRAMGFKGFNCNLKLLGQYPGAKASWDGGSWVGSWAGECAYLSTQGHGVMVIDASNPADPRLTETLSTPGFVHSWESLKYNPARHLLAATSAYAPYFDVYDVSDCAHPVFDASLNLGANDAGHAGNWAPDGKTYYGTQFYRGVGGIMSVIDVSNPTKPKLLMNWRFPDNGRPHDLALNATGTILYSEQPGQFGSTTFPGPNGLVTLDVHQVQDRDPHPQIRVLSQLFWNNGGQGQEALPVTYNGQDYLITTDELGSGGVGGRAGACARGLSPFGFAQIIDVNNPEHPFIVSKLRLGVDSPTACAIADDAPNTGSFGYDSHYCGVNLTTNPTMLGCAYFEAGLRIFDIKDPRHPSEIAYYDPPPGNATDSEHDSFSPVGAKQTDWASSPPVFVGCSVWDQFQDNGYMFFDLEHGPGASLCRSDQSSAQENLQ